MSTLVQFRRQGARWWRHASSLERGAVVVAGIFGVRALLDRVPGIVGGATGTRTPATSAQVTAALTAAGCPDASLALVRAQSAFETAAWQAMWNWNLGNITTFGKDYVILPGNPLHFARYASLQDGANAYVGYLRGHGLLGISDLASYVDRLQAINYAGTSQDYGAYERGMARYLT